MLYTVHCLLGLIKKINFTVFLYLMVVLQEGLMNIVIMKHPASLFLLNFYASAPATVMFSGCPSYILVSVISQGCFEGLSSNLAQTST